MSEWKCEQCGKCCKFIVIPVVAPVDGDVLEYMAAHGIAVEGNKLLIPARCEHLTSLNTCAIHACKFKNCKAGGEKECENAQRDYEKIKT